MLFTNAFENEPQSKHYQPPSAIDAVAEEGVEMGYMKYEEGYH